MTAEQCIVIRKVSVHENDTKRPKFWLAVGKLKALEQLTVRYFNFGDRKEIFKKDGDEESNLYRVLKEKLKGTVGHEVELVALEIFLPCRIF